MYYMHALAHNSEITHESISCTQICVKNISLALPVSLTKCLLNVSFPKVKGSQFTVVFKKTSGVMALIEGARLKPGSTSQDLATLKSEKHRATAAMAARFLWFTKEGDILVRDSAVCMRVACIRYWYMHTAVITYRMSDHRCHCVSKCVPACMVKSAAMVVFYVYTTRYRNCKHVFITFSISLGPFLLIGFCFIWQAGIKRLGADGIRDMDPAHIFFAVAADVGRGLCDEPRLAVSLNLETVFEGGVFSPLDDEKLERIGPCRAPSLVHWVKTQNLYDLRVSDIMDMPPAEREAFPAHVLEYLAHIPAGVTDSGWSLGQAAVEALLHRRVSVWKKK